MCGSVMCDILACFAVMVCLISSFCYLQVVQILTGEDKTGEVMNREQKPVGVKAILLDTFDLEDYTSSKYLNDLNRHKQLALE